jgi:hypothetical protein
MGLRREVLDPDDLLGVCIRQRGGSRPPTGVPRAPPNVVVALAGHGANDTRGCLPFQASWSAAGRSRGLLRSSYPLDLLPKALLIFSRRQAFDPAAGSSSSRRHLYERQNKETTARMASYLHCYQRSSSRAQRVRPLFDQKMYSQVAFGSPLITSREYSDNLTHAGSAPQGTGENFR